MLKYKMVWVGLFAALALNPVGAEEVRRNARVVEITLPGKSTPQTLYSQSYALVIGASKYRNGWSELPGVLDDVKAVSAALKKQGFEITSVLNPTRDQLDKALRDFVSKNGSKADNRLIVYFAGHGHTLTTGNGNKLGYIVPIDAPNPNTDISGFKNLAYSMDSIESLSKQMEAKHALFLFDSCFSGTIFRTRAGVPDDITEKTTKPVRQFITAGDENQTVPDHSIFRRQLIAALEDGEADLNKDGYITGTELGMFLEDKVTNYSKRSQTPRHGKIHDPNLDKGDFVFISVQVQIKEDPKKHEGTYWTSISSSQDVADFEAYLADFPNGQFKRLAENRIKALRTARVPAPNPVVAPVPPASPAPVSIATPATPVCTYCPEMVAIPAGSFSMGSNDGNSDEKPIHTVNVKRFEMGKYEVTRGQFAAFVTATNYDAGNSCYVYINGRWGQQEGYNWRNPGFNQTDKDPVACVNWDDAKAYVNWLSRQTNRNYRLPSEAEWEYACRGGKQQKYCGSDDVGAVAWYGGNSDKKTHPVGQKQGNGFGLYDMSGNV